MEQKCSAAGTWNSRENTAGDRFDQEIRAVTKKEIVRTISEEIGMTQLQTKEIVQKTFNAIVETLVEDGRIELRNFGVFEVKRRAPRKARNPRTGEKVFVAEKFVVTFKPGKDMEERVRELERQTAIRKNLADGAGSVVESLAPQQVTTIGLTVVPSSRIGFLPRIRRESRESRLKRPSTAFPRQHFFFSQITTRSWL